MRISAFYIIFAICCAFVFVSAEKFPGSPATNSLSHDEVIAYWTPERKAAAKPVDMPATARRADVQPVQGNQRPEDAGVDVLPAAVNTLGDVSTGP
jgi:hypothetical protein